MQNADIWKSIEALCDEAESVIKNGKPVMTVIQSVAPPAPANQGTSDKTTLNMLSSKPAPPKANIVNRPTPQKNFGDAPLSPATMTEIAAAIDRASQRDQKPQIMDQQAHEMSDQLRKDLMIEISLAVRSVLSNELPKIVRHAVSDSLYELINSSNKPVANNFKTPEAKQSPEGKNKKITSKKRAAPKKQTGENIAVKKTKAKKQPNKKR